MRLIELDYAVAVNYLTAFQATSPSKKKILSFCKPISTCANDQAILFKQAKPLTNATVSFTLASVI